MELVRAFGEPSARETPGDTAQETDRYAARLTESQHEIAVLQERLRAVERERDHLAAVVAEAQERERWLRGQLARFSHGADRTAGYRA